MSPRPLLALALLLLPLSAGPARAAEQGGAGAASTPPAAKAGAVEPLPEDEFETPPPGSPADQALWKVGRNTVLDIAVSRNEASRLLWSVKSGRMLERLDAVAQGRPAGEAAPLRALRTRLADQWNATYAMLARRWPVDPTRGCGYPVLMFESSLRAAAAKAPNADVVTPRADLKTCTDRAGLAVKAMTDSNRALSALAEEAQKQLVAAGSPAPGATGASRDAEGASADGAKQEQRRD